MHIYMRYIGPYSEYLMRQIHVLQMMKREGRNILSGVSRKHSVKPVLDIKTFGIVTGIEVGLHFQHSTDLEHFSHREFSLSSSNDGKMKIHRGFLPDLDTFGMSSSAHCSTVSQGGTCNCLGIR